MGNTALSVEEMCREFLRIALGDGLIQFHPDVGVTRAEELTAGDLVVVANYLNKLLDEESNSVGD